MLEGAVARILNQLLGKYVVDLDTENLNVGIFSGLVQLTDLKLKTEALYELRLPIQVRAGTIGKINLQIPWSALWSQPICVTVEDIHVLCKPIVGEPYDPENNKRLLRGFKRRTLEAIAHACSVIGGPGLFSEHLITNIVNNIHLSVSNIHIRYECYLGEVPTAVGLCIGAITAENTNSKWKANPAGYKSSDNLSYHMIKVEALCAYCNSEEKLPEWDFTSTNGYYAWKNSMANSLQNYSIENEFNFFVRPMSIKLKMTITKDHGQVQKISSDCIVHDLNVHLDKKQFETLVSLYDELQRAYVAWDFLAFRPNVSIMKDGLKKVKVKEEQPKDGLDLYTEMQNICKEKVTRQWWHYAYNAVILQRIKPYTWSQMKQTRHHAKHYSKLYQQHLLNPNDTELKLDLQQYEDKLNITNIIIGRQEARLRVRTQSIQEKSFWDILPSPEKQLLCERIGFLEIENSSKTCIDYEYNFRVGNTCVALTNSSEREILVLTLTQIIGSYRPNFGEHKERAQREEKEDKQEKTEFIKTIKMKNRKRDKGALKIEGIIIEGANEKEHLVPIISSNHEGHDSPAYFLRVDFERYPDSGKRIIEEEIIKMRVNFVLEQLEFVYDKYAYEQIGNYFEKNYISLGECMKHVEKYPKNLLKVMEKQLLNNWDFNMVLNFPYFVIPEKGLPLNSNQSPSLIIDLGQLKLSTELCRPSLIADNATQMELEEQMYSKYHIELKGQQILFALQTKDNWKAARRERDTELHLLPKMKSTLAYCSCIKKIKTIAEHKINWNVQNFKVNLSEKKILHLLGFIKGFEDLKTFKVVDTQENNIKGIGFVPRKTSLEKKMKDDVYKGSLPIAYLKHVQNGVTINDGFRKRKERLRKQPSIIDKKIEHHAKNTNVNEAWARCVDLPGLEDNISPSNYIKIIWRLVLNELQVSYSRSSDTTDTPYLNLRFGLVTIDLALMTYGPAYQFSLGNIILTDKMHTTPSGQYLDLLHSPMPSSVDVFSVLYRKVGADCPDYWSHFHGVETSLVADFGTLHVMLHQEAIRTLIQYYKYIKDKILGSSNETSQKIVGKVKELFFKTHEKYFKTKYPVPSGSIKFSHSGRLGDLNLRILDSDFDILNIHLQGLEADFLFRANERFVFRSFLSSIDVEYLSDVTLYKKVLYTDEDKVFELKYVRFSDISETEASSFKFTLGQLHVTCLYKLIVQLHRFLINLGIGHYCQIVLDKLDYSMEKATETLKTNTKINLSVNIKGPVFLIPQKSSSPNVLIVDTGNFSVENFFKESEHETIENILIKWNEVVVSRGVILMNASLGSQETIVEPMQVQMDVKRIIPKAKSIKTLTWEVDGFLEIINITLGQKDITMLLAILTDTMTETSSQYQLGAGLLSHQSSLAEDEDSCMRNLEVFFAEPKQKTLNCKISCDGINILLFFDSGELLSSPIRDLNHGLAKLQINELASCCVLYTDGSMDGKLSVDTVLIEEIGPESLVAGDNRILYSPLDENKNNNCMITVNKPPVIDITFHRNRTLDKSIDIIIGRLSLTLSVPFIEKLALFVIECLPKESEVCGVVNLGYVDMETQRHEYEVVTTRKTPRRSLTVALRVNKPEFIFLIEGAAGKRRYLVTKAEILLDYSRHAQRENFVMSLSGLHTLYSSQDGQDMYTILKQCDVELSKALTHEKGEKLSLSVSSLYLQFSNKVVYAINDVLNDIVEHFKVPDMPDHQEETEHNMDDLWEPRKVVLNYPTSDDLNDTHIGNFCFTQKKNTQVYNHQVFLLPKTEFIVLFELETLPVLVFKSTLEVTISDWSTLLSANCDFTIQANYFNAGKQKWEPFIDPIVLEERAFKPFEVNVKLFQDKAQEIAHCSGLKPQMSKNGRASITKGGRPKKGSDDDKTSDEEDDESGDDMVYLEPTNAFHGRNSRRVKTSLSTFLEDSDSENDDGSMEKLAAAISDLFTGDWNESDGSDIENSTDSEPEEPDEPEKDFVDNPIISSLTKPFRKSLYLLIDCKDTFNVTVTPSLIKTLTDLVTLYSNKTLSIAPTDNSQAINLVNDIGPKSRVEIFEKEHLGTPASRISESDCKLLISKTYEKEDSCPNSPTKEGLNSLIDGLDIEEGDDFESKVIQEEELNYDFETVNSLDFNIESTTELYEKINRYQMKIFIPHFYGLQTSCPRKDAQKLLRLHPCQVSTTIYYLAFKSSISKHGMSIVLSSPLSIKNETCFALSILYQPSVLQQLNLEPVGDVTNPFETTMRIAVLEPHETYNVPIHIAYHCKLFIQPAYAEGQYIPSQKGIWWKDLATDLDAGKLFTCQAKTSKDVFALRVVLENNLEVETLKQTVPNYVIRLLPAMVIRNFLPYAITVDMGSLLASQEGDTITSPSSVKIEPGEKNSYYSIDTTQDNKITFRLQTYQHNYSGNLTLTPHMDEKVIALVNDSEKSDLNLPLNIKAERDDYYELLLYTSYWIINKTQLSVQLKATSTNTIYRSKPSLLANEDIILFSFKRHTRQTLKLRVYDSEFSNEFGLDCPGTTGLVVCKDIVRKKRYAILLKITLSEMCPMTKIVTLLPCFMVSNQTSKNLRFMEHNEKTDLWIDLPQGQEIPFWPETTSYQMYVKLQEQKTGSSQGFFFAQRHKTLLKILLGALTVTVTGGIDGPFKVTFTDYKPGDAPLLIKNMCQELFLKLQQQNLTHVTLLSPQNELLYTWDDPLKNRLLVWNIYNNKASNGFVLDVERSLLMERYQYGQERINFGNVTTVMSSSEDSDSDSGSVSRTSKGKPKDRLTIYWVIYNEVSTNQRTLLFTQDSILFGETLQKSFSEVVNFEVLLSLGGVGVSLFTNKEKHRDKEHLYMSLNDYPATWEVNVGHKWKVLTLELASWIEDKYRSNQKRCQLKDYVHIDFEKMFMLKPFFAELRRSYSPALYFQLRKSPNNVYLNLKVQNLQIDNKTLKNQEAIILNQLGYSGSELGSKDIPFLEVSLLKSGMIVKSVDVKVRDFQMHLQSQLFKDLSFFFKTKSSSYQFRKDMARILGNKTKKLTKRINLLVEQIKCSSVSILLNVQSSHQGNSHGNTVIPLSTTLTKCQGFFFPPNMTPYMPSEGVKHRMISLEVAQVQVKSLQQLGKFIWGHFKTQFLQQYYSQVLGLQVLVNPYAIQQTVNPQVTGHIQDVSDQSGNLLYSLRCLLGHVNMSSVAVEQCIVEMLSGHHNFIRRPNTYQTYNHHGMPKIVNWSLRHFNPGVVLALNQIIASKGGHNGSGNGQSDGEMFFRGTGKALVSLLTRHPDDKSNSVHVAMEALKRASLLGEPIRCHQRLTRYSNQYLGLGPFSIYESMGCHLVENVAGGRFKEDTYWTHSGIDKCGRSIIIVTLEHVLRVNKCRLWGPWELEWALDLDEIISVPKVTNSKLIFNIRQENDRHKDDDLAANNDGKLIIDGEEEALIFLQVKIEQAIVVSMEDKAWTIN